MVSATVTTATELEEKLNDPTVGNVLIDGDFTITDSITVKGSKQVVLDLRDNTLKLPENKKAFVVEEGSSLTIIDGILAGNNKEEIAILATGSEVILNNVDIKDVYEAIEIRDDDATGQDSRVVISDCNIETEDVSVYLRGNSGISSRETYLLVENSKINSTNYIAVMGNGSAYGTEIYVNKSTLEGKWSGIYQPQQESVTRITDSTIIGYTAIAVKGGDMYIEDSQIHGTGAKAAAAFSKSGYTDTGDAIYVETNYDVNIQIKITGDNTNVISDYSYAIQVYEPTATHVEVLVFGGKYSHDITAFLAEGYSVTQEAGTGDYIVGKTPASETQ